MRSSMGEDRFNALILQYEQRNTVLDIDKIIDNFAQKHPRNILLIVPLR